ncbi:FecCD family ABC transporter permease [Catenuloplanes atrovinosus]|uniref:Iron complex transport system permease protein n=1 Tax=Catenuloplanes atrovinosus TaxID=137266 RepID=A0AAE4C897_9ACTN|nr:iron chelate uptake ABC transporter family permease subunit [Catenuloplanes atrovinosus]MDR7273539.1 iron complex transport system permease protein [Catenuloplanes atrovinosus]
MGKRLAGLLLVVVLLLITVALSIAVGSRVIPLGDVLAALGGGGDPDDVLTVRELRIPRTLLGLIAGAALGLSGALMQTLTRNPLADPGIFGVNLGAAAGVVLAITIFGVTSPAGYVWFAFAGSVLAMLVVYSASAGRGGTNPARLALAGVAVQFALAGVVQALQLADRGALDQMRFWVVGSLANREAGTLWKLAPFFAAGIALSLLLAHSLNALALGDDTARALGAGVAGTRVLALVAVTVLCGAATAACGPLAFVGLMVPHLVRAFTGPDQRWVLPYSMLLAPVVLLGADVLGRVLARPGELQVGIVMDVIGGIVFIAIVRARRVVHL